MDAIDLPNSPYREQRVFHVVDYDGRHIPFEDRLFDIVFSSNVLEHIADVEAFQREIHRVLKPGGMAVHILPSSAWRGWTALTHILKTWKIPEPHGEHASNAATEMLRFRRREWCELFQRTGWQVIQVSRVPIFYTGRSIMDSRIGIGTRQWLSTVLGCAVYLYVLRKAAPGG